MSLNSENYSNLSNEFRILFLCARTQQDEKNKFEIQKLLDKNINWSYLIEISTKHKIKPLLYWNLNSFEELVPKDVKIDLELYFHKNLRKNLLYLGHLLKIVNLFESKNIKSIPYKGPTLALNSYGNLGLREFVDLDIFICKKDLILAKNVLNSNGYQTKIQNSSFKERLYLKLHRDMLFVDENNEVKIEIQWNFIGNSFTYPNHVFEIPKNITTSNINNKKVFNLPPENTLLVLCIHASGHLWQKLSWICDVAEFINKNKINWISLIKMAKKLGFYRILQVNVLLAIKLLDLKIPDEITRLLSFDKYSNKLVSEIIKDVFCNEKFINEVIYRSKMRYKIRENTKDGLRDFFKILISEIF